MFSDGSPGEQLIPAKITDRGNKKREMLNMQKKADKTTRGKELPWIHLD